MTSLKYSFSTFILLFGLVFGLKSDVGLNTVQMIENHGYICETHHITTEDGYILTYHRIPHGINVSSTTKRPVFLLVHGLMSSSADYVNMGPERSLAYILADSGYDVWIGNARGTAWSRNHTFLDIEENRKKFFDFSWHEIGYYDLPSAIDYILNVTNDDSLHYVGHSQGTTVFFVLTSCRPEYNSKIKIAHLLAPSALMAHTPNPIVKRMGQHIDQMEKTLNQMKLYEIRISETIKSSFLNVLMSLFDVSDQTAKDPETLAVIKTNAPANSATKQVIHFGQLIKYGTFTYYDYGTRKNLKVYGTEKPPLYDLSKITAPVALYYSINDGLQAPEDVEELSKELPNVVEVYLVPHEQFNHFDFLFAKDIVRLVYNKILEVTKKYLK